MLLLKHIQWGRNCIMNVTGATREEVASTQEFGVRVYSRLLLGPTRNLNALVSDYYPFLTPVEVFFQ